MDVIDFVDKKLSLTASRLAHALDNEILKNENLTLRVSTMKLKPSFSHP